LCLRGQAYTFDKTSIARRQKPYHAHHLLESAKPLRHPRLFRTRVTSPHTLTRPFLFPPTHGQMTGDPCSGHSTRRITATCTATQPPWIPAFAGKTKKTRERRRRRGIGGKPTHLTRAQPVGECAHPEERGVGAFATPLSRWPTSPPEACSFQTKKPLLSEENRGLGKLPERRPTTAETS